MLPSLEQEWHSGMYRGMNVMVWYGAGGGAGVHIVGLRTSISIFFSLCHSYDNSFFLIQLAVQEE